MTSKKGIPRKPQRLVRRPATRYPHLLKRMRQRLLNRPKKRHPT